MSTPCYGEAGMSTDDTPWLDDDEMRLWRSFVVLALGLQDRFSSELHAEHGLDFDDYEVLVHLSEAPDGHLRMSDLAERVLQSKSRLSQRVDRMTERGLVERRKCPDDRRGTLASLTDLGWSTIRAAAPTHVHQVRRDLLDHIAPTELPAAAAALERAALAFRDGAPL